MDDEDGDVVPRKKLSHAVEERLLAEVRAGGVMPGDPLPSERELMARYNVGRPAIREAMQNLQRMGLIEIRHGERPRVASPSFDRALTQLAETMRHVLSHSAGTLDHLKQARLLFERETTRIAAQDRTAADLARLRKILSAQAEHKSDPQQFLRYDGEFHAQIARVSANPIFTALSESLFSWLTEFHAHLVRSPGLEDLTLQEHGVILQAIEEADPDLAVQLMTDHLNRANSLYSTANLARTGESSSSGRLSS